MAGNYPEMNEGLRPERIELPKPEVKQTGPETMGQPAFSNDAFTERSSWERAKWPVLATLAVVAVGLGAWKYFSVDAPESTPQESTKAASMLTATDVYVRQKPIVEPTPPVDKPAPAPKPAPEPMQPKPAVQPPPVQPQQTIIVREAPPARERTEPKGPTLSEQKLQSPMMGMKQEKLAPTKTAAAKPEASLDGFTDGGQLGDMLRSINLAGGTASRLKNRSFMLPKGTFINCVMETAVNTSVPGMTSCRIPENVFSMDGRTLLIEAGSRAFGEYRGAVARGMDRIFMLWTTILTPEGVEIRLDSPASDSLGRMGVTGDVNHHWWARFGNALLFSIIDDSFQFAMEKASDSDNSINNYSSTDSGMSRFLSDVIRETGQIPPTITMNQGTRVGIFVARNIDLSSVYEVSIVEEDARKSNAPVK